MRWSPLWEGRKGEKVALGLVFSGQRQGIRWAVPAAPHIRPRGPRPKRDPVTLRASLQARLNHLPDRLALEGAKPEQKKSPDNNLCLTRGPPTPSTPRCKFFSLTETPEDYTIIVDEEGFLELPSSEHLSVAGATWLALNVVSGGGGFSGSQPIGVTKIAKSVIAPLADQNISVFMLSTYQTDFILVRERDLPFVTHTLSSEFTILRVVNGETVAAENLGITNGFVKPKMVQRPVIHPLSSPSNRFCVTSLDPDTLPAVATLLMDVMFYSNGVKDPMAAGEDCGHIRFFSFSLIEGYISLVMDVQTQQRFPSNLLFTSASGELWKMVRIGGQPLGFDECGIVAQISEPLAAADIPAYYISTFKFDHALVPEENINAVIGALKVSQAEKH
uniref:Cytosolic arginine sensor for mTORC1 subunit 2 n=1 Tax=Felis catus TaxID=9685 RepID=A0ABI7YVJ6_FELCA